MAPTTTTTLGVAAATTSAPPRARLDRRRSRADRPVRAGPDRIQTAVDTQHQPNGSDHRAPPGRPAQREHEVGHDGLPILPSRIAVPKSWSKMAMNDDADIQLG